MLSDTAEKVDSVTATLAPVVLEDVAKRYGRRRRGIPALDRVSLSFGAGSFTAVLGVSGSGKSTLLQCAAGLERPSAGSSGLTDRLGHRPAKSSSTMAWKTEKIRRVGTASPAGGGR